MSNNYTNEERIILLRIAGEEKILKQEQVQELLKSMQLDIRLVMDGYHKPTALGKMLRIPISGQKVNKLLQELVYQVKEDGKWYLTDAGAKYAICKPYFRQSQKEVWVIEGEILWNKVVIIQLENLLEDKERRAA